MNNTLDTATVRTYLDFSGLGTLRAKAQQDQTAALKETAQQFEGLFIQMVLKSMRDAIPKDEENTSSMRETFEGLFDQEISGHMAQRSALGVTDFLVRAVQRQQATNAAAREPAHDSGGLPLTPRQRSGT